MKPGFITPSLRTKAKIKDNVARWISFLALAALLGIATLPGTSGNRDVAANTTHWSQPWHG